MNQAQPLIPFGKYKGQPIEVLSQDKPYTDWLLSQASFRSRNPDLVNIIINNFQEPSETPEHNALQVKFLSKEFRIKFAASVIDLQKEVSIVTEDASNEIENEAEKKAKTEESLHRSKVLRHDLVRHQLPWNQEEKLTDKFDFDSCKSNYINTLSSLAGTVVVTSPSSSLIIEAQDGYDVYFDVLISLPLELENDPLMSEVIWRSMTQFGFKVEIKPCVSDDYPSVLRQMKLSGAKYLFLREYNGIGASRDEFVELFLSQGIYVVFNEDVDAIDLFKLLPSRAALC